MMLTPQERADARRQCGYPWPAVEEPSTFHIRAKMEARLSNLSPAEMDVTRRYLDTLRTLENNGPSKEARDLLNAWRARFRAFLGVAPWPMDGSR